jgi:hypothetical protein
MSDRRLTLWSVLTVAGALVSFASALAAGQTWAPSLTPDGQPDLQGVWSNHAATPLERPALLEGRQFLTDDEVARMKDRAAQFRRDASDNAPGDALFLATLAGLEHYKNPQATELLDLADEKEFDNRTSLVTDPPDGKIPPLTPEGQQRQRTRAAAGNAPAGPEDLSNFMRCITYGVPRLGGNSTDNGGYFQIFQTQGYFAFLDESGHDARVIPLDGRPHLPPGVRLWNGDSRGRWEGSTLVVDTTNFSAKSLYRGSAENLHLVERFTRTSPDLINYEITLEDPTTWRKPWTAVIHLKLSQDKLYESACHEGNFDIVRDVLVGARADEKKTAAQAAQGNK